jgi:hypothetical protein
VRRLTAVLALLLVACSGDSSEPATAPSSTTTSTSRSTTTLALSPTECANTLGSAISMVDISRVDASDGLSADEVADLEAQMTKIEQRMPDITTDGRCSEHLHDPQTAFDAIEFAPEATILVLAEMPGIMQRGLWGAGVAAYDLAFQPSG